jgi:hypothetical protein
MQNGRAFINIYGKVVLTMLENKDSLIAMVKALDQVAYALHGFSVKALEALGADPATDAPPIASTEEEPPEAPKPPELEDVRAVFMAKTRAGHTQELKALLADYGVEKLTQLDPEHYPAVFEIVESMGDSK